MKQLACPTMVGVLWSGTAIATGQATSGPVLSLALDGGGSAGIAPAVQVFLLLTTLALLPAIVIATTSFARTIIVLGMLRHAFGMQDTPPNVVLTTLALCLTAFTMAPTARAVYTDGVRPAMEQRIPLDRAVGAALKPVREFMIKQTRDKDLALMLEVAHAQVPDSVDDVPTVYIVPAFLLSELKTAFVIGFVIFLPFLLLDLVVSSILMSMGMIMVPPSMISLPLKVLMFVLIDGWGLVVRALLESFR